MRGSKWRKNCGIPLHENYNKLMNSKNADIQNINYVGGAGLPLLHNFTEIYN